MQNMESKFEHYPQKPKTSEVLNAYVILCNTHDASSSFLHLFESTRKSRKAKGMATDEEQDLLRAMLIFATSGLDSMIKQLNREALPLIINKEEGAKEVFKKHIERKLNTNDQINCKLLAKVLVESEPQKSLIEELVADLTVYLTHHGIKK
jgi:CRISPR/Cas system endoribonuclease Cas6 (RAMP superfamily)